MVVKEDGTKWACQSCLKGHRVSSCTHKDRPLLFVPRKGRPISQCQHCRVERKKRSAHVKCDCGDKSHSKEKCIHLRDADKNHPDALNGELGPLPEDHDLDDSTCCCHHGGKCTCSSIKKEPMVDFPQHTTYPIPTPLPRTKPRLTSAQSDGHLTQFANGHHKPVHRNNYAAHDRAPYKMPRSHTDHGPLNPTRRSVDSLPSINTNFTLSSTWQQHHPILDASGYAEPVPSHSQPSPMTSAYAGPTTHSANQQHSMSMLAEDPTPFNTSCTNSYDEFGFHMPSTSSPDGMGSIGQATNSWPLPTPDMDINPYMGETWNSGLDWSMLTDVDFTTTQPALTNASSGTISEIDELPIPDDVTQFSSQAFYTGAHPTNEAVSNNGTGSSAGYGNIYSHDTNQPMRWSMPINFPGDASYQMPEQDSDTSNRDSAFSQTNLSGFGPSSFGFEEVPVTESPPVMDSDLSHFMPSAGITSKSRPKPVYQKANTVSGNIDWEQLLKQCEERSDLQRTNGNVNSSQSLNAADLNRFPFSDDYAMSGGTPEVMGMYGNACEPELESREYHSTNNSQPPNEQEDYFGGFGFNPTYDGDLNDKWIRLN